MPLANRSIQPVLLGRKPLTEDEKEEGVVQVAVCQSAVLGALIQLASLVRHADDLFCDLAEECQEIYEKTESIKSKVERVKGAITALDSTSVTIPVGTLKGFCQVSGHHVAKHGYDNDFFTKDNRPYCIRTRYSMCEVTPIHALRGVDLYRKDGLATSLLFKLWPIALKDTEVKADNMNMPRGTVPWHSWKKRYKKLRQKERPKTIHSIDKICLEESHRELSEQNAVGLSKSQPSVVVSVDTSGAGFERMSSFRRSLKDEALSHGKDKKKRRRTVSGVPDNILQEIELFENGRRILRDRPRQYSLDDLDQTDLDSKEKVLRQYLMEMDAQIAEREELRYAEREGKFLRLIPCRRSRSVPRCVRMMSSMGKKTSNRLSLYEKKSSKLPADETSVLCEENRSGGIMHRFASSVSLGSQGSERLSRSSSKRSSLIGTKIKSLVSSAVRPRPRSLDFDSVGVIDDDKPKKDKPKTRSASMSRMSSTTLPEGTNSAAITRCASSESTIGPGSYYYFDSNTIPRAQKKYDFPWDSLPKDWTTSVKLREISKRCKEDRQSSSGNWSQSGYSSNRQSMDSDVKCSMPSTASQHSLGKDSGRDSPMVEKDGLDTGYMGDAASMESVSDTKSMSNTDSDDWIRSLAERAASRGDVSSTDASALENLSRLTKENIRNLDNFVPGKMRIRQTRNDVEEDGESSVYSLDQEGFYTSFHNDSGLRRSSNTLLEEDEDLMMPTMRETKSLQSILTNGKTDSRISQTSLSLGRLPRTSTKIASSDLHFPLIDNGNIFDSADTSTSDTLGADDNGVEYGDTGTLKAKKNKKKAPPPPPPRTSSCLTNSKEKPAAESSPQEKDSSPNTETSSESSDQEVVYARLKLKTSISAQTFPSWGTTITSDEEESTLNASHERLNAESSEVEEMFLSNADGWLNGTLPRVSPHNRKSGTEDRDYPANSWPRFKKPGTYQHGILKTPEKDKNKPGQPKTLNFAPVVNLFDAQTPGGVELPLSRLSSSDESGSPPALKQMEPPSTFCQPTSQARGEGKGDRNPKQVFLATTNGDVKQAGSLKHMVDDPGQSRQDVKGNSLTYANSHTPCAPSPSPSQMSQDSFFGIMSSMPLGTTDKFESTMSSNSTIALSDIDSSSLTHVSLDDSTPSGSTLSLNWDTDNTPNPTPVATPAQTHKIIKHTSNDLSSPSTESKSINSFIESVPYKPIVTNGKSDFQNVSTSPPLSPPPPPVSEDLPSPLSSSFDSAAISHTLPPPPPTSEVNNNNFIINTQSITQSPKILQSSEKHSINNNDHWAPNNEVTSHTSKEYPNKSHLYGYSNSSESSSESNDRLLSGQASRSSLQHFSFPNQTNTNPTGITPSGNRNVHANVASSRRSSAHTANSFQYNQSWSVAPAKPDQRAQLGLPTKGAQARSDRRRSSPVVAVEPGGDYYDRSQRRRSGSNILSPTDSGFGSPSAINEPIVKTSCYPNSHSTPKKSSSKSGSSSSLEYKQEHQQQQPVILRAPKTPHIKQSMLPDSVSAHPSSNSQRFSSGSSSQSSESLNSQLSMSSTSQLITKPKSSNLDFSRSELFRGNSAESLSSNSSAGRSDSYRVALTSDFNENMSLLPNTEKQKQNIKYPNKNEPNKYKPRSLSLSAESSSTVNQNHRPHLSKSLSTPTPAMVDDDDDDDGIARADSYRCAMQNAQASILGNWTTRNSSYRLATNEEDIVITDNRMESCNLWTGKTGGTRDVRRMGITDVDQLKNYNDSGGKSKQSSQKALETVHARKVLAVKVDHSKASVKEQPVELRRTARGHKEKSKQKPQPSSYIRFDPIFESGEDLRASNESLRPPSITSIQTLIKSSSNDTLLSDNPIMIGRKMNARSGGQRRSISSERKGSGEKTGLLGSIKTTIRSIGGSRGDS